MQFSLTTKLSGSTIVYNSQQGHMDGGRPVLKHLVIPEFPTFVEQNVFYSSKNFFSKIHEIHDDGDIVKSSRD